MSEWPNLNHKWGPFSSTVLNVNTSVVYFEMILFCDIVHTAFSDFQTKCKRNIAS